MKIYRYPSKIAERKVSAIINRGLSFSKKDYQIVNRILDDVRHHGDEAVIKYARRFDAPPMTLNSLKVSAKELNAASKKVDRSFVRALNRAASQIESFHRQQVRQSWIDIQRPGTLLGQMVNPVDAAGVYVPGARGGETPLVSTVLMTAIPARIAGVENIVMVTPSTKTGGINPHLLVAAKKVGIKNIYKIGSAWAIAALAYGTETIRRVDVIAGPGNIYVTLAKKIVAGTVGVDMIAGPSEVLVIADDSARPEFAAADLLAQAEHDVLSSAILVTDSGKIAREVAAAVDKQLATLPRRDIARESLKRFGAVLVVEDLAAATALANRIAPEHLELQIDDPFEYMGQIRNAGAVFLGHYTPEPVGDYMAGPNHVLPTAGTARFASALSVDHFVKTSSIIHYSRTAFKREAADVIRLAETEGLDAHASSIKVRL
ncbi:Histidinol dehydrogenase (EC [Olavius sp. associated proteobacterium Delta 1]|nr:Histidinol dehydrogenase (EC [Olavius sp. associated proteobacterium Delta 1]